MIAFLEQVKCLRPRGRQLPKLSLSLSTSPSSRLGRGSGHGPLSMDQRGATLVTYVLVLPLLILLIFGSYAVWRIMVVRQSLSLGTYQAAWELSQQARYLPLDEEVWREIAEPIVRENVEGNHLIEPGSILNVDVTLPDTVACPSSGSRLVDDFLFTVKATLRLHTPIRIPYLDPVNLTLTDQCTSYVQCPREWKGTPPPEEHIY
jgi:hypothetical protein